MFKLFCYVETTDVHNLSGELAVNFTCKNLDVVVAV